jgi:hypothetical protein
MHVLAWYARLALRPHMATPARARRTIAEPKKPVPPGYSIEWC